MIVRELTGDIYFGQPKGIRALADGEREGYDTMLYSESEIRRIAHVALRHRAEARRKALLGRQGERPRDERALARNRDGRGEGVSER